MSKKEKAFTDKFLPHFATVVGTGRTFQLLRLRFNSVLDAVDKLKIGLVIANAKGEAVLSNREASRNSDLGDGISISRSRKLTIADKEVHQQLWIAIAATTATAHRERMANGALLSVNRISGLESFLLSICPIRDDKGAIDANFGGALIFIIDPLQRASISTRGMKELYDLTKAEIDVLNKLIADNNTRDIVDLRNTSLGTVRWQIKSILAKTNTHSRAELIRLALSVNLPVEEIGN